MRLAGSASLAADGVAVPLNLPAVVARKTLVSWETLKDSETDSLVVSRSYSDGSGSIAFVPYGWLENRAEFGGMSDDEARQALFDAIDNATRGFSG